MLYYSITRNVSEYPVGVNSMNKYRLEDLIEVVYEPDFSKSILLELQKKYNLNTVRFYELYKEGMVPGVSLEDAENWIYNFEIFMLSKGNIKELVEDFLFIDFVEDCSIELTCFDEEGPLIGQAPKPHVVGEEVIRTSSYHSI